MNDIKSKDKNKSKITPHTQENSGHCLQPRSRALAPPAGGAGRKVGLETKWYLYASASRLITTRHSNHPPAALREPAEPFTSDKEPPHSSEATWTVEQHDS